MEQFKITRRGFLQAAALTGAAAALCPSTASPLTGLAEAKTPAVAPQVQKIRSACRACGKMECGVWVTVQDGRAVKIEGDNDCLTSEGNCCTKSMASLQAVYHPNRLRYPMKRTKPKGEEAGWVRITWDEALDTTAKKLAEVKEKYGAESIFGIHGTSRVTTYTLFGMISALGSPNGYAGWGAGNVCKGPRWVSSALTSWNTSAWMSLVDGVKVFTQWGSNTEVSNYDDSGRVTVDRRFKAQKHIVVNPRLQNFGPQADIWLPLRPGTDGAMALSWIDVVIKDKLYDKTFVQRWSNGPFLYCADIQPSGFTWTYAQQAGTYPLEIKTRLLKESDIKEGGSAKRFMVWDELSKSLKYFDADSGLWEGEKEFKIPTGGQVIAGGKLTPYSKFDPAMEPALFGAFKVKLKDGKEVSATPVFQLLADRAAKYTPEKAAEITWCSADKIREAARAHASQPGNGGIGYMLGVEHGGNSINNTRALNILSAITGNLDTPGGNRGGCEFLTPTMPYSSALGAKALSKATLDKMMGADKFPLFPWMTTLAGPAASVGAKAAADALHTGKPYPLRAGLSCTGNFMTCVNSTYINEAMKKLDFYFCSELWYTPMAELADILVPATHWLETRLARPSQGASGGLGAQTGPVKVQGENRADIAIFTEILKRMNIPWWPPTMKTQWPTVDEMLDFQVSNFKMTWQEFDAKFQKDGWMDLKKVVPEAWGTYRRYETGAIRKMSRGGDSKPGFPQPTMKLEILSTILESYHPGMELPDHREPPESPVAKPELAKEFPLILTTGRKIPVFFHSEHRQLPWCREIWPVPKMEINPETAEKLGLKQGDWVWIESPRGKIRQTVDIYAGIDPRVVNAEHLWWYPELPGPEHGWRFSDVNQLIDPESYDPIFGSSVLRGYPVKVYKAQEGAPAGIITSADDPRLKQWLPQSTQGGA